MARHSNFKSVLRFKGIHKKNVNGERSRSQCLSCPRPFFFWAQFKAINSHYNIRRQPKNVLSQICTRFRMQHTHTPIEPIHIKSETREEKNIMLLIFLLAFHTFCLSPFNFMCILKCSSDGLLSLIFISGTYRQLANSIFIINRHQKKKKEL